ncbi:hypothetical protein G3N97_31780 [Paraburkholderia sp. Ac-20347]|nr:hypothetical protein [Paraburkholderia sp. Ac-20347]
MPYFEPLNIGGVDYTFDHLEPFKFEFYSERAKKKLCVHVTFTNHCFSKKYEPKEHNPGDPIFDRSTPRPRMFCPIRHRLSYALRELIESMNNPKTKVWECATERNWTYSITVENPDGPYHLFFEVTRATGEKQKFQDLNFVVESAYHEDPEEGPPAVKGSMTLWLLCGKVFKREKTSTQR